MKIKEYHQVYLDDISNKKPLTEEEVLSQIKLDYGIKDKEDINYANQNIGLIKKLVNKLIDNRVNEQDKVKRIINEFFYRNRILGYFPKSHLIFTRKWDKENRTDAFLSDEYKTMVRKQAIRLQQEGSKKKKANSLNDTLEDFNNYLDKK